jgi:hypothetical protein
MSIDQATCVYCHPFKNYQLGGRTFGKKHTTVTEWWDFYNQKRINRKVLVTIRNPIGKHPRLIASFRKQFGIVELFNFPINNCPFCGRKLNAKKESADFNHDDDVSQVQHLIEYYDPKVKSKLYRKINLKLKNQTGMLEDVITFRDNPKCLFEFQLNYCPRCGDPLATKY